MQRTSAYGVPSYKGYIYLKTPAAEAQSTTKREGQKDCKSQTNRKAPVRLCLLEKQEKRHP